jgi:hypothetical protein
MVHDVFLLIEEVPKVATHPTKESRVVIWGIRFNSDEAKNNVLLNGVHPINLTDEEKEPHFWVDSIPLHEYGEDRADTIRGLIQTARTDENSDLNTILPDFSKYAQIYEFHPNDRAQQV